MHDYTQSHIKNAQPGPHIFGDFSVNSKPISLKFCKGHFFIQIVKLYSGFQKLDYLTRSELKLRRPSLTPLN